MSGVGYISLRESKLTVGQTFHRVTGMAKGDSISITQPNKDVTIIEGAMGGGTFVFAKSQMRTYSLVLVPSSLDVTVLLQLRALEVPFPFGYEHGVTKLAGFMAIDQDPDVIVSDTGNPITLTGIMLLTNKIMGAQGLVLQ